MNLLVIDASGKLSRSCEYLSQLVMGAEVQSMRWYKPELPLFSDFEVMKDPKVEEAIKLVKEYDAIILCTPIHNYCGSAILKNFLDLTSNNWTGKKVMVVANAGSKKSYSSVNAITDPLFYHEKAIIFPKFFYADPESFDATREKGLTEESSNYLSTIVDEFVEFSKRLK